MAYVRGARRHPMFAITITPEMEAQIERELAEAEKPPANTPPALPRPTGPKAKKSKAKCGTLAGHAAHRYYGEEQCFDCREVMAIHRRNTYKPRQKPKRPHDESKCGTLAGYSSHRRHGESHCQPCKDAVAAHRKRNYWAQRGVGLAA